MKEELTSREFKEPEEDTPESRANFRISVFGTGSKKSEYDEDAINLAEDLAVKIIRDGQHKIVTGGYESGIMGAIWDC